MNVSVLAIDRLRPLLVIALLTACQPTPPVGRAEVEPTGGAPWKACSGGRDFDCTRLHGSTYCGCVPECPAGKSLATEPIGSRWPDGTFNARFHCRGGGGAARR